MNYITLHDKKTGIYSDLTVKPYTFTFVKGEDEQRFRLLFLSPAEIHTENTEAYIYSYLRTIYVNLKDKIGGDIFIYNIAGQLVENRMGASGTYETVMSKTGIYIVKVFTNNESVVQKVIIR